MFLYLTGGPEAKAAAVGDMVTARASENGTEMTAAVGWRLEMEWDTILEGRHGEPQEKHLNWRLHIWFLSTPFSGFGPGSATPL